MAKQDSTLKKPPARSPQSRSARGTKQGGGPLSRPVAGIPLWGWGTGLVVAIAVGLYFRSRGAKTGTTTGTGDQTPTETDPVTDWTGEDLAQQIQGLGDQLADLENALWIGTGQYEIPADGSQPVGAPGPTTTDSIPDYQRGSSRNLGAGYGNDVVGRRVGAILANVATETQQFAPNNLAGRGAVYVSPAAPAAILRGMVERIVPKGASQSETAAANLAAATTRAKDADAAHRLLQGASKLPAVGTATPSIFLTK